MLLCLGEPERTFMENLVRASSPRGRRAAQWLRGKTRHFPEASAHQELVSGPNHCSGVISPLRFSHRADKLSRWLKCTEFVRSQARRYIADSLGQQYAEGSVLELDALLTESDSRTPMVCLLSMGSDPTENIERLAKSQVSEQVNR